ncbi:protein STRUBBELIG-RECEPTOR FAMILY 3-like isoform X3 [Dioscorea cayenensis subsp. rotundata]|uniref:Protein STRUBBELIG-RECEPTOR FAMILY 3-like isoform X3 n=1 Tax=Dioscorea cayennensis subsp. rotundata TaxID=55577 RepID=A0AB40BXR8_DIOCR|nr:protein STRUBBELIG-RECEPTOR FAMILY 3-like isoform X3 [Dioscorea cayenensis subsp. rotundata]
MTPKISFWAVLGLMIISNMSPSLGYTDPRDVYAINNLYAALGFPPLSGWISLGGDPCSEGWQGVQCVISNITAIVLNGTNLGGQLGDKLDNFATIITLDFSNNHIGGSIPENLPFTMREFFLSDNQFTGSIPNSLSELSLLANMSFSGNHLGGEIPDAFEPLTSLVNLDLSYNNLSGPLPLSMGSLSSLTTLHIQNNRLTDFLDVLQDLPLLDLNVENNLFSGPVPAKLLSIPNFKKDGNPFNTTIAPSPMLQPPLSPSPKPVSVPPVPKSMPINTTEGPIGQTVRGKSFSTTVVVGCMVGAAALLLVAVLLLMLCKSKKKERNFKHKDIFKTQDREEHGSLHEYCKYDDLIKTDHVIERAPKNAFDVPKTESQIDIAVTSVQREALEKQKEQGLNMSVMGVITKRPSSGGKVSVKYTAPGRNSIGSSAGNACLPTPVTSFSVASLQQYTNSFDEDNHIRDGTWGKVYLAELPNGKLLEIMKLGNVISKMASDEYVQLVSSIYELRHPNILDLVGYCAEFGQRILVYNYYKTSTLCDALQYEAGQLSWNARLHVALGAAKALEYLHEACRLPVIHQKFGSTNILLDDELRVRVSDCGLASLMSSVSVSQFSGSGLAHRYGYEAPELSDSAVYTDKCDVYSFGVVMLELLTGRKAYDSSRHRGEQHLVRWACYQLHDINALSQMVDPSIAGNCSQKSLSRFADIISRCIQRGAEFRPPMSQVVQDLTLMLEDASRGT